MVGSEPGVKVWQPTLERERSAVYGAAGHPKIQPEMPINAVDRDVVK